MELRPAEIIAISAMASLDVKTVKAFLEGDPKVLSWDRNFADVVAEKLCKITPEKWLRENDLKRLKGVVRDQALINIILRFYWRSWVTEMWNQWVKSWDERESSATG